MDDEIVLDVSKKDISDLGWGDEVFLKIKEENGLNLVYLGIGGYDGHTVLSANEASWLANNLLLLSAKAKGL